MVYTNNLKELFPHGKQLGSMVNKFGVALMI